MKEEIPSQQMLDILHQSLKSSMMEQRKAWAKQIVNEGIEIKKLADIFLFSNNSSAMQFSWLLSDIGIYNAKALYSILSYLFEKREQTNVKDFRYQFVKYWSIAGIPKENEGEAINLLFRWLNDSSTSVSIKTHSALNLYKLSENYPDIKNELKTCIENQLDKTSISFRKSTAKILANLRYK
jgi:hypothetical protein